MGLVVERVVCAVPGRLPPPTKSAVSVTRLPDSRDEEGGGTKVGREEEES